MRKVIISLLIVTVGLIIQNLNGQTSFEKLYAPFSNLSHSAYSIVSSWQSGYILTGTVSPSSGFQSVLLMKIDSLGNIVWSKRYGSDYNASGSCIQRTQDSCYIICGELGDPWYSYILKINENGDTIWTKHYQINYSYTLANSIVPTIDGKYVIAGFTSYPGDGGYWMIQKLNSNGQSAWYKLNGDPYYLNMANSIDHTLDNGFLISGCKSWYMGDSAKAFLAKTDSAGNVIWTKYYPDHYTLHSGSYAVKHTLEGGYIWGGAVNDSGILVKTNASGDVLWSCKVTPDDASSVVKGILVNPDSSIVCCGTCYLNGSGPSSAFLEKTDKSGNIIWAHLYTQGDYRNGNDSRATPDNGYILAGLAGDSAYVIKTDENSMITGFRSQHGSMCNSINIFPNPNHGTFNILTDKNYKTVEIIDPLYRNPLKIQTKISKGVSYRIELPNPSPGIYFLQLTGEENEKTYSKFLVE